ncbi:MAG: hypothetical protein ACPL1A_04480 [Candidatus Kapaibacteriota bacterium]
MFEELINYKVELISSTFAQMEFITFDAIMKLDIPEFVKRYFNGFIISKILEIKQIIGQGRLNFDDNEISENWQNFVKVYQNNYTFTKEEYNKIIKNSCELYFNFILRPQTTLLSFTFRDELLIPFYQIHTRLNYFPDDNTLITSIKIWYEQKYMEIPNDELIERNRFSNIIAELESENYKYLNVRDVINWFEPIYDCNIINEAGEPALPIAALYLFFDDKKWKGLKQYLAKFSSDSELYGMTKEQLSNFLMSYQKEIISSNNNNDNEDNNFEFSPTDLQANTEITENEFAETENFDLRKQIADEEEIEFIEEMGNNPEQNAIKINEMETESFNDEINELKNEDQNLGSDLTEIESFEEENEILDEEIIEEKTIEIALNEISENNDNFDFESMADFILNGNNNDTDANQVERIEQKEDINVIEVESEEVHSKIEDLMSYLESKIPAQTVSNTEFENIDKSNLKFMEIDKIENETKRELCKLLLEIKD